MMSRDASAARPRTAASRKGATRAKTPQAPPDKRQLAGQALAGEDLTVFGDGSQTRSFGYIDDLVGGIYRLMLSGENEPVNLGNPEEMTLKEMAELIIELTDSGSRIVHRELPEDDPKVRQPDIAKAKRALDWEPQVSVREGLSRTVKWFQESLPRPSGVK